MKIALIAGFSNEEIRSHLRLKQNNKLFYWMIRLFHLPERVGKNKDHASWINNFIQYFEKRNDIEFHVLGPQIRLKNALEEFEINGIQYHFFRSEWSSFLRIIGKYRIWKCLQRSGKYTRRILDKIKPDLVILSGAENPVTSVSILYAQNYPRLCLCQVVYNDPDRFKYSHPKKLNIAVEQAIFSELKCFGVYCKKHYELLSDQTKDKYIFKFNYPPKGKLLEPTPCEKQYDFVNFAAAHSSAKGTQDSIKALAMVKKHYPNVTLNIVGGCSEELMSELEMLIDELDLKQNVVFTPFFEKREDLFLHVQKSRFAVLPCKLDNTSGTMTQSMLLGLPLIVYKTTGTPNFNAEKECALIAEMDDVEGLSTHMLTLMGDPEKAEKLRVNGRWYKENQVDIARKNWDRLVNSFQAIIDNFKQGTPIPEEGLFDPDTDI